MTARAGRAVLFDLDGTVADTAPDLAGAANALRAARGKPPMRVGELAPGCTYGGRGLLYRALGLKPADPAYAQAYHDFMAAYRERLTGDTRAYPGVWRLVATLAAAGYAWGIVTNKAETLARPLIDWLAFEPAPGCVVGGDSAGAAKPDPAPIHMALAATGCRAPGSIYIGDSARDVAAGRAAGLATVAVAYGYIEAGDRAHDWGADRVVHAVAELAPAIAALEQRASKNARSCA